MKLVTTDGYVARHARRRRLLGPRGAGVVAAAVLASGAVPAEAFARGAPPVPRRPTDLPAGIEPFAPYQPQEICFPEAQRGVVAFRDLVLRTYPRTGSDGVVLECSAPGRSEHKDGRAWDWLVRADVPQEKANAAALLHWLLKTDDAGYQAANARRLGIMYIIWDHRMWRSYHADLGWQPYEGANPHTGHVHFSFGWAGALGRTSFFSKHVAPPVMAPALPSFSPGSWGPGVHDLQRILGVRKATGYFDKFTRRAVIAFQREHGLLADGVLYPTTWAALLPPATPVPDPVPVRYAFTGSPVLRAGASGPAVAALQRLLAIRDDGSFGPGTETALRQLQARARLSADGVAGAQTWNFLRHAHARAVAARAARAVRELYARAARQARAAARQERARRAGTALPVRRGARGPLVSDVQRQLHLPADGVFGPGTERAVRAYQRRHRLGTDGVVGERTWRGLHWRGGRG